VSLHLGKAVNDYLIDLKDKLEAVADLATTHAKQAQEEYATRYNLRARDKHFSEGDFVIVLATDNSGKLCPRWIGPVTIVKVKSPYSYLVDMGNGQVRHIHANKIRKFVARSHSCGVISDNDVEFGCVLQPVNDMCIEQPSQRVSAEKLLHLNDQQRDELLAVLDDHSVCFRDRSGLYTGAVHCIKTTSEFKAKTMLDHRVPEIVKLDPDVEIQVETLNLFSELHSLYVNYNSRMLLLQQSDLCCTRTYTIFCVVILVWLPPDPPWLVVFSCVASTRPVGVVSFVYLM